MNIFTMFSNAMSVTSKMESASYRLGSVETESLINELCDTGCAQSGKSDASASDASFKGPLAYPS